MPLLVIGFLAILAASFGLIVVLTGASPENKTIGLRMAAIQTPAKAMNDMTPVAAQLFKATRTSRFGWLEEMLQRFQFSQKLQIRIMRAQSSTTVGTLILSSLGLAVFGYALVWFLVPVALIDVAAAAALAMLPFTLLSYKGTRRMNAFNAVLAEAIDMLARALRAGHSVAGAIETISQNVQEPAASEFAEVFKQQNMGLSLRDALMQLLDRVPSADLRVLVTAILVQKDTGGNLAEILDRTVAVIRDRLRIQGEIRVQTAQGRLTGWILSALPVVMLVLINLVNPGYSSILLTDPTGHKLIYVSLGMLAVGALIIRHIVNGIEV
jgi:tight adherence protein B